MSQRAENCKGDLYSEEGFMQSAEDCVTFYPEGSSSDSFNSSIAKIV